MTDTTTTRVIFRRYREDGSIIAILLDVEANPGCIVCYQHLGQHAEGHYSRIIDDTRPALPTEYAALRKELEGIGYRLIVKRRRNIRGIRHTDTYRAQGRRQ